MEKQNLIVCGCSFTKGHFLPETETWGGYVANKLNLALHNIATGGMGNEWITQRTISYFLNNKELLKNSVVMVGWSEPLRLMGTFEHENGYNELVTICPQDFYDDESGERRRKDWPNDNTYHGYVKKNYKFLNKFFSSFPFCLYKSYYSIYVLKQFLESNNIPYLFFDAINKIQIESIKWVGGHNPEERYLYSIKYIDYHQQLCEVIEKIPEWMIDDMLNDKVESQIFGNSNYISFDGMSMLGYMWENGIKLFTEGNPGHPNSIASELFSDMIIKEYEKIYNK
jgi:hypothetical protein